MIERYLEEIGLQEKEVKIYLALLAVDQATVLELAQKTKIKRPTVYTVLESLAKKGLISETTNNKKTHYQAEPPERLKSYVERQKLELDERTHVLDKEIIPQLKSLQREEGERPVVKYYEGKEGAISALEELFYNLGQTGGLSHIVYPNDLLEKFFTPNERKKYRELRLSHGIKSRVLYTSSTADRPSDQTGDRVKVDTNKYPLSCSVAVYKDRVSVTILDDKLPSIFIKNREFAETIRSLIDLAIDNTKETR